MCSNELASSRLNRPGFWSTVLSWTGVRPFWRVIVFFAPIGVPAHSGAIASSDVGNEYRSFFSAIAKTRLPSFPAVRDRLRLLGRQGPCGFGWAEPSLAY